MPDPQVLYVVASVVVLGLVVWVVAVLAMAPNAKAAEPVASALPELSEEPGDAQSEKPSLPRSVATAVIAHKPLSVRPAMPSHQEIQDGTAKEEEEEDPTGPHALILVTAAGRTDPGLRRTNNEDRYLILPEHHLLVIADGMGRHAGGEVASKLAVEAMQEAFDKDLVSTTPANAALVPRANRLRNAVLVANERVLAHATNHEEHAGMGTTVVAAYFSPNKQKVYIAHVGDSRCYRIRRGELKQLTEDHTLGAAGIKGSTASLLSRAVGVEPNVEVDVTTESPLPGDVYLLCSDGLSRMAKNEEILAAITSTASLEAAVKKLIEIANERGGKDNITAIIAGIEAAPRPSGRTLG